MPRRLVLLALAALAILAPTPSSAGAIANGEPAAAGAFPFSATLVGRGTSALRHERCGGSLVAPDRVLTAAHCVVGAAPGELHVLVGRDRLSSTGGTRRAIRGFYAPSGYRLLPSPFGGDAATTADLAVLVLDRPVDGVAPLALGTPADVRPGTPVVTIGHGLTGTPPGGAVADDLRLARQTVRPAQECASAYRSLYRPAEHLCTFDRERRPNASACGGDSGGPLLAARPGGGWAQVGLVTWGGETREAFCSPQPYPDVAQLVVGQEAFVRRADPVLAPAPVRRPFVARRTGRLVCRAGTWQGERLRFSFRWTRGGRPVRGAIRPALRSDGRRGAFACQVTARNAGGRVTVRSMNVASLL